MLSLPNGVSPVSATLVWKQNIGYSSACPRRASSHCAHPVCLALNALLVLWVIDPRRQQLFINKKPAKMVGLGETARYSTLQSWQSISLFHCVITGDLASNRGGIMRHYAGRTRFTYFCAVFSCILQPTGSSCWRHISQICGTGYP